LEKPDIRPAGYAAKTVSDASLIKGIGDKQGEEKE
jgi:hypothetical protein